MEVTEIKEQKIQDKTKMTKNRPRLIKKLIFDILTFVLLIILGTILLNNSLEFDNEKIISYEEKSNLDYRVYLKENGFYEQEYLGKDMLYVASLIDKIAIDFDYTFESEKNENINFNYSITAKLSITNLTGTKSYFEKTYTLLDNKSVNMTDNNIQNIKEQININYPYYNSIANSFKNQYGLETDSKLTVYMLINKQNDENSNFTMNSSSSMNIIIPVSEKSIDISLDYKEINETSSIIEKEEISIKDIIPLIVALLLIIISIIMMIKAMRNYNLLKKRKNAFDKYITKILKEYDRLIAESSTLISFEDKEIIDINKFTELLDIHDNLQLPIMYYQVIEHKLCYFYINHNNVIYLLKIKETDMEKTKNEK